MKTRYRITGQRMSMSTRDTAAPAPTPTKTDDDPIKRLAIAASSPNRTQSERLEASNSLHREWWKRA